MSEVNQWLVGFCVGSAGSFLYFWGLWVTVKRLQNAANPLGLYATSLVLRVSLLGIAFALVLNGDWRQVAAAAIAFVISRFVVVSLIVESRNVQTT